jgi:hypothetical protein
MENLTSAPASVRHRSMLQWLIATSLAIAALFCVSTAQAQTADRSDVERQVKAAYLYKFGSYVEWPDRTFAGPDSPIRIGVIGADALADELAQMVAGRTINGRQVVVRKLRREDPIAGHNILFIGRLSNARVAEILAAAKGQPMLTVTESDEGMAAGSMINFVVVDGKVRFEAAPKVAGMSNLNISARLLAAAYKVAQGAS